MGEIKWMQGNRYGVMVHYLSDIQPQKGPGFGNWDEMTEAFNIIDFANEIEKMGAGWVIFPFGQNSGRYCSYNSHLEAAVPGCCSRRDIMWELAQELKRRGIRLIAYLPSEMDANIQELREQFGWDLDLEDKSVFQERYQKVIREWAERFGTLIDGWWFDGCYDSLTKDFLRTQGWTNDRFDYCEWKAASCAGNKDAVMAMNPGAEKMEYAFTEQDYLGGEANTLNHRPEKPLPGGMQWHCLVWLDCFWAHWEKAGEIAPPRFTDEELWDFYKECRNRNGAVTWNIGIYQDGTLAEKTVEQVVRLKERLESI